MFADNASSGSASDHSVPLALVLEGCASPLPSLEVDKLLENGFLRELVLALGSQPHAVLKGLKVAMALDAAHPALLFGVVALRPTFVDMFRSFRDYDVLLPYDVCRQLVHPDLTAALRTLDLHTCSTCGAHVLRKEKVCWMCKANGAIASTIEGFRGVQRLRTSAVLERAVIVPPEGLSPDAVVGSAMRMEILAGSLLTAFTPEVGATIRYYRIFSGEGETGYLRVIRSGICDFVSHVSAVEIFMEFPTVAPGFLSWIEFPDSP